LLEAAACGLPQVATAVGGVEEAVLHEKTGFVALPDDPDALAAAMRRLSGAPPAVRHEMGLAAREHALARFDLRLVTARWEELYRELLEAARRAAMEP
jgi:glycosyltransferase involved in cell wall biosynthesis